MSTIIKPLGNTISIDSVANNFANATIIKVLNTGAYATLVFKYANNVQYADIPVGNNESVYVQKNPTDLLLGSNMRGAAISWPKG